MYVHIGVVQLKVSFFTAKVTRLKLSWQTQITK